MRVKSGVHTTISSGIIGQMFVHNTNSYGWGLGSISFNVKDNPGAGVVSYFVRVFTHTGSVGFICNSRSMMIEEVKR
ncbi:hypothetical protein MBH78_19180 [Oceanimonas sp. NS1]|nr:hypothetical protein [Oceanimonas sp. NS1]